MIYAPNSEVPRTGGVFHVVTRDSISGRLLSYVTRVFLPAMVNCARLVCCRMSPTGDEIVFVQLYPKSTPKGACSNFESLEYVLKYSG